MASSHTHKIGYSYITVTVNASQLSTSAAKTAVTEENKKDRQFTLGNLANKLQDSSLI